MNVKTIALAAGLFAAAVPAVAQSVITENYSYTVSSGNIADTGAARTFSQMIAASQIVSLTEVRVGLNLTGNPADGGWAGDMFVSLNRNLGSQTAILLNQVGVTGSDPAGHSYDGWNVTFQDSAANGDIHLGQPSGLATTLSSSWQPDGRLSPTDTSRPAVLSLFNSSTGNATWHLTLADLSAGGSMTLNSWSLSLTGLTAVPEPETYAAVAGLALVAFAAWRRGKNT